MAEDETTTEGAPGRGDRRDAGAQDRPAPEPAAQAGPQPESGGTASASTASPDDEKARRIAEAKAKAAALAAARAAAKTGEPAGGGATAAGAAAPAAPAVPTGRPAPAGRAAPAPPPLPPELEALRAVIEAKVPGLEGDPRVNGALGYLVPRERLVEACRTLRDLPETRCDYLACLSGVDYPEYVEVVYHLSSLQTPAAVVLKARAPKDDCRLDSVTGVWPGANWHEREVFDLLGVTFEHHPDLRRILLPEDFPAGVYPLRKDFVDRRPRRERQVRVR